MIEALRPHVPRRYGLLKGVIVDSGGRQSDPQDIVLLDSLRPSILGTGQNRVVPVEGVVGSIQVKSIATKSSIESGIANIASAKRLLPSEPRYGLPGSSTEPYMQSTGASFFGGLLCLRHEGKLEALLDHHARCVTALPPRERCDALCIVDEVAVLWGNPSMGAGLHFAMRGEQAEAPLALYSDTDSLLFFYTSLLEHLSAWIPPPISWIDYVFGPRNRLRDISFKYSYWLDDDPPDDTPISDGGDADKGSSEPSMGKRDNKR